MRIVLTWIVALLFTFTYMAVWYIIQPLGVFASNIAEDITILGSWNTTGSGQMYTLFRLTFNVGIPIMIIIMWVWAFISSQAQDWRSEEIGM